MRVLHVGKFFAPFAGGIENFMADLSRACHSMGVAQACLVHRSPGQDDSEGDDPDERFEFLDAFERVPMAAQISYAPFSPGFGRALERMLADFRPDVLHLHLPNTSAFWALRSPRARAIPWVVHWHSDVVGPGLDAKLKLLYPFYRPFEQALLKRADAVIATSPPYLDSSRALGPWHDKCRVIPLGMDPERLDVADCSGELGWRRADRLSVLAVGRLSRYKGFEGLIRAARAVDGIELVIAGSGKQHARMQRLVPDAQRDRLRLVGGVSDGVRNRLLAECDVLCMPSVNRAEAFGLALVEAMAAGKPAIATRVPGSGMGWVVEHERTGWLVEPGDVDELCGVLQALAADRTGLAATGRRARERFDAHFRIDAVAREVVDVYRGVGRRWRVRGFA